MKLKHILLLLPLFVSAQISIGQSTKQTILKTNLLNLIMIPSAHIEQQMGQSSSLQANFHRGSIVFISPNEWLHTSIDYRKYFNPNKRPNLEGFYLGPGINLHHNYLSSIIDENDQPIGNGISNLGIQFKLGYQWMGKNNGLTFDLGTGVLFDVITLEKTKYDTRDVIMRLNASLGYNFARFWNKNIKIEK